MGIKIKLLLAAGLTIAAVSAFGWWSDQHRRRLGAVFSGVLNLNVQAMNSAADLKHAFVFYDDTMLRLLLTGDESLLHDGDRTKRVIRERIQDVRSGSASATLKSLLDDLEKETQLYFADFEKMVSFYQGSKFPEGAPIEFVAVWSKQFPKNKQSLSLLSSSGRSRLTRIYSICEKLLDINKVQLEEARSSVDNLLSQGRRATRWAMLATFAMAGLATVALALSILRPLGALLNGVNKIMAGNLNFEMPVISGDEIGVLTQDFNAMTRQLKQKQEQLLQETITDALTGVYNFRYFQEVFRREIERGRRYSRPLSILIVDIDHFKNYNDTHGHEMGNVVLRTVAQTLRETLRAEDTLARYGGEEFAILLPDTAQEPALVAGRRLREAIESAPFPGADKQPLGKLTVSIGGACYPLHAQTGQGLIERADRALYKAKNAGRNTIEWA
ncbi:MAG: diguanylate cyclase [Elusimicrobiota bacterium]